MSPATGSSPQSRAETLTGGRRRPSNVAQTRSPGCPATDRQAVAGTPGVSARPTTIAWWPVARQCDTANWSETACPMSQSGL